MTPSDGPLLDVSGLCTRFATEVGVVKAVQDVTFSVHRGEILGLVGESGSGKSVTGYSIMGLIDPPGRVVAGRILFEGRDLSTLSAEAMRQLRGNRIAMMFRHSMMSLNPLLRVDTQMIETIRAHGRASRSDALGRARAALVRVGIASPDKCLKAYPYQLSGGTRQRVAIAIALLNGPALVIADEPTAALDVTIQKPILLEMQKLARENSAALILITDDLSLIAGLADRICVMYAGRIVEVGTAADVLTTPRHPYTRGLLDSSPAGAPPHERLRQIPGMTPSLLELTPGCAFRSRCPRAQADCEQDPEMRPQGGIGQAVRCFHPLEAV